MLLKIIRIRIIFLKMGKILGIGDNWTPPVGPPLTDIFKRIATASESFMKWLGEHEHLSVKIFK